ncbi:MAG: DUF4307 domain-containing protein [Microbacterium sp.]
MTIVDPAVKAKLDDRYGRTRTRRQRIIATVAIVLVIAAGGWLAWTIIAPKTNAIDYDDLGYDVTSSSSVTVRFQITSPHDASVVCALEALDTQFGVVGWRIVEYPAASTVSTSYTETIPTVAEATTGVVKNCWVP